MFGDQADDIAKKYGIDLLKVQFKTTMMGMVYGVIFPGVHVIVAYVMDSKRPAVNPESSMDALFWGAIALSSAVGVFAFFFRGYLISRPSIKSEATFATDFAESVKQNNTIMGALHGSISLFGLTLFFMGAQLDVALLFAILSVIAFQILRLRGPILEKSLVEQQGHVSAGRYAKSNRLF